MECEPLSLARRAAAGCEESARRLLSFDASTILRSMVSCPDPSLLVALASVLRRAEHSDATVAAMMSAARSCAWPRAVQQMLASACATYFTKFRAVNRWKKGFDVDRFEQTIADVATSADPHMRAYFLEELHSSCDSVATSRMCVEGLMTMEYPVQYAEALLHRFAYGPVSTQNVASVVAERPDAFLECLERSVGGCGVHRVCAILAALIKNTNMKNKMRVYDFVMRKAVLPEWATEEMAEAVSHCRYVDGGRKSEWEECARALFGHMIRLPINMGTLLCNLRKTKVLTPEALRTYFESRAVVWDQMSRDDWMFECEALDPFLESQDMMQVVIAAYNSGHPIVQRLALHALSTNTFGMMFWSKKETSVKFVEHILRTMPTDDVSAVHFVSVVWKCMPKRSCVEQRSLLLRFMVFKLHTSLDADALSILFDALNNDKIDIDPRSCAFIEHAHLRGFRKRVFAMAGRSLRPDALIACVAACGTRVPDLTGVAIGFGAARFDEMVRLMYPCLQPLIAEMQTRRTYDVAKLVRTMAMIIGPTKQLSRDTFLFIIFAYSMIAAAFESHARIDDPSAFAAELIITKLHLRSLGIVPDVMFEHYRDALLEKTNRAIQAFASLLDPLDRRRKVLLARAMMDMERLESSPQHIGVVIESLRLFSATPFKHTSDVAFVNASIVTIHRTCSSDNGMMDDLFLIAANTFKNWVEMLSGESAIGDDDVVCFQDTFNIFEKSFLKYIPRWFPSVDIDEVKHRLSLIMIEILGIEDEEYEDEVLTLSPVRAAGAEACDDDDDDGTGEDDDNDEGTGEDDDDEGTGEDDDDE